jgi:hypothetical protein
MSTNAMRLSVLIIALAPALTSQAGHASLESTAPLIQDQDRSTSSASVVGLEEKLGQLAALDVVLRNVTFPR